MIYNLFFSRGSYPQPIWLDNVQCNSSTSSCLAYCETCPSSEYAKFKCGHSGDITVECCEL